jgi:serine/threonine-protein phosphatase 2B catalytic subunit
MPIAAQVGKRYLCVHGGISPDLKKIEQINKIKRTIEVPESGLFCDLLWADPMDEDDETGAEFG